MEIVHTTKKLRVLVVEDNENIQTLLEYLLEQRYEVVVAGGYDEALQCAAERTFDLLLLDINLNEHRSGIQLLRTLRRIPEFAHTPAIALTAYAMYGDRTKLMEFGFDDYVAKPFTRTDLLRALQDAAALMYPKVHALSAPAPDREPARLQHRIPVLQLVVAKHASPQAVTPQPLHAPS